MTCIVGLTGSDGVYLGADHCATNGHTWSDCGRPKIFRVPGDRFSVLFGFTDTFRLGDILEFSFDPPSFKQDQSIQSYMRKQFIESVRKQLEESGYVIKKNERIKGGTFLVALFGSIFRVQSDFSVLDCTEKGDAIGSGEVAALGSLKTSASLGGLSTSRRVELALQAAEAVVATVRSPFDIIKL